MPKTKNPTLPPSNQYDYTTKTPATKISDAEISSSGFRPATRPSKNPCFAAPGASAYNSYYHPGASLDNPVGGSRCADASSEELDRAIGGAKRKKKKTEGCNAEAARKLQECVKKPFGKDRPPATRSKKAAKEKKKVPRAVAELGSGRKRGRPASSEGGKLHIPKSIKKAVSKGATKLVNEGEKVARKQGEKALQKGVAMVESQGQKALDQGINTMKEKAMNYVNPEPMDGGVREARMRELFELLTNDPSGGKHHFGKALKHVSNAAVKTAKKQHVGKKVGKIAKDYAKEMAPEVASAAATAIGHPEMAPGAAAVTQNAVKGLGKPKRTNARAQIVGKIMKERGVGLAEASKIVKSEGLYKK